MADIERWDIQQSSCPSLYTQASTAWHSVHRETCIPGFSFSFEHPSPHERACVIQGSELRVSRDVSSNWECAVDKRAARFQLARYTDGGGWTKAEFIGRRDNKEVTESMALV
jgi:hypothetical protein